MPALPAEVREPVGQCRLFLDADRVEPRVVGYLAINFASRHEPLMREEIRRNTIRCFGRGSAQVGT